MGNWKRDLVLVIAAIMILAAKNMALGAAQKAQLHTEFPEPDIPQPQFFCGYCHILTYPHIVKKGFETWKKDKHNKYGCVECHYPPKEAQGLSKAAKTNPTDKIEHIPKMPPERFSYLQLGGETVQTRPRIIDASCMTAQCHGNPDDKFKTKKIKFTEKVPFIHEPHLEKKNQIEGQQINCTSCHQHETEKKKFEVSKASCHLCHFKNVKFNESRGRCELCHELPKKPIQTSGQEPITHEMLKKATVSCGSCHFEVIQAAGRTSYEAYFEDGVLKTALVLGAGDIKKESCLSCHDQANALKEADNKKLMHQKHVTAKTARCFACHRPIKHKMTDLKPPMGELPKGTKTIPAKFTWDKTIRDSCTACHPDPHRLQLILAAGLKRKGVLKAPSPHVNARANCMACHVEKEITEKGERIMKASSKTCILCHKGREKLLQDWKTELTKEIKYTREVEKEALEAVSKAKSKLPEHKIAEAQKMLKEGQENLNIVQLGNGVHNKKYSIMLLDAAIIRFEDLIDYLEEDE